MSGGHTDVHVCHGGILTAVRYRGEILASYITPYVIAIGYELILLDNNARSHRARFVDEYLENEVLDRMEWPTQSSDLNPIKHLWDYLGRHVADVNPPLKTLNELEQALFHVWAFHSSVRQFNWQYIKSMPPMHYKYVRTNSLLKPVYLLFSTKICNFVYQIAHFRKKCNSLFVNHNGC